MWFEDVSETAVCWDSFKSNSNDENLNKPLTMTAAFATLQSQQVSFSGDYSGHLVKKLCRHLE